MSSGLSPADLERLEFDARVRNIGVLLVMDAAQLLRFESRRDGPEHLLGSAEGLRLHSEALLALADEHRAAN